MSLPSFCLDPDAVLKDNSSLIKWRNGIPNYSKAHQLFDKHKSTNHQPGSIEDLVQNLVQNWEKEVSHKTDPNQWSTINEKYQIQDLQVFYDPNQLFAQLTEISPFALFIKLPNSHPPPPPSKKVLEQDETNNEVNGLNRKINIFQHKRKEDYALNPQSTMCMIL